MLKFPKTQGDIFVQTAVQNKKTFSLLSHETKAANPHIWRKTSDDS